MSHKISICVVGLALVAGCQTAPPQPPPAPTTAPISTTDLDRGPIIGELGKPLGVVFEIEATIYRGSDNRSKMDEDRYLLRVIKVDGKTLPQPVLMEFAVPGFVSSDLASDEFQLAEKAHGKSDDGLSSDQVHELEKGYVGKTVHLSVWENGRFSGMPSGMPKQAPSWQDTGFYFFTELVVLIDHDKG
jgi:hypothetical protein